VQKLEAKPGMLNRPLRAKLTEVELTEPLTQQVLAGLMDGLSMAAAGGALVGGHDALCTALRHREIIAVAVANDASDRTLESLRGEAGQDVVFAEVPLDRGTLGGQTGHGSRAAVGATRDGAAIHLVRQLRRLRNLG